MNAKPFTTSSVSLGPTSNAARTVIYVLVVAVVVTLIVLVTDYFYPFLPFSPTGSGPSAAARAGKTFWKAEDSDAENLTVPANQSPTNLPAQWAVSVQIALADSRAPSVGKYRHILHRGSNPVGLVAQTAGSTGQAGIQPSDISGSPQAEQSYTDLGLPQIMNPGVFLDKYKNDIHIFIHTRGTEEGMHVLWLESLTIEDVPLRQPLTLGIVCNGRQLDVYTNCRLYSSKLLRGTPYLPKADNQWFGRYGTYPFAGVVKNLELWDTQLGSSDYIQVCRSGGINTGSLPSTCTTAGAK